MLIEVLDYPMFGIFVPSPKNNNSLTLKLEKNLFKLTFFVFIDNIFNRIK